MLSISDSVFGKDVGSFCIFRGICIGFILGIYRIGGDDFDDFIVEGFGLPVRNVLICKHKGAEVDKSLLVCRYGLDTCPYFIMILIFLFFV